MIISSSNILVNREGRLKLADFGLSHKLTPCQIQNRSVRYMHVITLTYRPPELLNYKSFYSPADIWSVGCVIAEMFSGRRVFPGRDVRQQRALVRLARSNSKIFLSGITQKDARDLVTHLLAYRPEQRLSPDEALVHVFFTE